MSPAITGIILDDGSKNRTLHIYRTDTLVIHIQDNWDSVGDIKQRQNIWRCLFGFHTINIQNFH